MKIYIYKTAKKRIQKRNDNGGYAPVFNNDGYMDYLLGTTQEVVRQDVDGDYVVVAEENPDGYPHWYLSPCACRVVKGS